MTVNKEDFEKIKNLLGHKLTWTTQDVLDMIGEQFEIPGPQVDTYRLSIDIDLRDKPWARNWSLADWRVVVPFSLNSWEKNAGGFSEPRLVKVEKNEN